MSNASDSSPAGSRLAGVRGRNLPALSRSRPGTAAHDSQRGPADSSCELRQARPTLPASLPPSRTRRRWHHAAWRAHGPRTAQRHHTAWHARWVGSKSPSPAHQWRRRASEGLRPADPRSRLPPAPPQEWHRLLLHCCQLWPLFTNAAASTAAAGSGTASLHRCQLSLRRSSSNAAAGLPSSTCRCRLWRLHRRCRLWRLHHRRWQLSLRRSCLRRWQLSLRRWQLSLRRWQLWPVLVHRCRCQPWHLWQTVVHGARELQEPQKHGCHAA